MNSSSIQAITIRLKPGEDLKASLETFVRNGKIKAACILSCVGSLTEASIRFANKTETTKLNGKHEIVSLTGTLAESGMHLHLSISDGAGKTIGGHLMNGSIVYTTAEIVIGILPDVVYDRITDSTFGFKELHVESKTRNQ